MAISLPNSARAIVLQNHMTPEHPFDLSFTPSGTFDVKELPIPSPVPEDSLLLQSLYFSNDPGPRLLLQKDHKVKREDIPEVPVGTPFPTRKVLGRVLQVGGEDGRSCLKTTARVRRGIPGIIISAYLGALGLTGSTAYWALKGVLKPKETDSLVRRHEPGNVAVQLAKKVFVVKFVVGIAGTDEKCKWLKSTGADEAVNNKSATFAEDLEKATPEKVDLFFDNVGGAILDEVLLRMKTHGNICLVGAIANIRNAYQPAVVHNYARIVAYRFTLHGSTLNDYLDRLDEAESALLEAAKAGKLVVDGAETVIGIHGEIEQVPRVWNGLFTEINTGRLVTNRLV